MSNRLTKDPEKEVVITLWKARNNIDSIFIRGSLSLSRFFSLSLSDKSDRTSQSLQVNHERKVF